MRIRIGGHSGFGDNLHQRAALKEWLGRGAEIWLETPTPCIYHDMPGLHLLNVHSSLRTQAKNERRESGRYEASMPLDVPYLKAGYNPRTVRTAGSVVGAISESMGLSSAVVDFRMPVPPKWKQKLAVRKLPSRYIVYRPPTVRAEWTGGETRNPDPAQYVEIFKGVRGAYPVVSIADLAENEEWLVGEQPAVDFAFHAGELDFEELAALVQGADFVYTTPGLLTVLAQAVEAPCITVFGGFERAMSYAAAIWSRWLPIEAINPCGCWSHTHNCDKRLDVPAAIFRARSFVKGIEGASRQAA